MKQNIGRNDLRWWMWRVTLVFVVATLLRWPPSHSVVMVLSALQVVFFFVQEKSFSAYPVQVRLVYFAVTLLGMLPGIRLIIYLFLLVETFLITFLGRSLIAMGLKYMPWNKDQPVRLT